jgi:hypothetical protein
MSPYTPLTSVPSPGITPEASDFLDVDSPEVNDFHSFPLLECERHWMSHGHIRTGLHDTTASSASVVPGDGVKV